MSEPVQTTFDYHALDTETRRFVQQKADETHGLLKRTAEHVLSIGQNLRAVKEKLPHGRFLPWVQSEFAMSRWSAQNFMRVAEKFGDTWGNFHHLPASVLYELAAPSTSESVLDMVQVGQIAPTLEAIKEAKEAERLAREAEQQARTEAHLAQQQLLHVREESDTRQAAIAHLTQEIALLQERITTLSSSLVEIREVEKPIVSAEVTAQLTALQQEVQTLTQQRNTLSQQVVLLGEEARARALRHDEGEPERRIRLNWYKVTSDFRASVIKILSQWPSPLDTQVFEADDWTRLSQTKALVQRFLEECRALTGGAGGRIVEGTTGSVERAYSPSWGDQHEGVHGG